MTNWGTYTFPLDLAHQHVTSNKDDAHWCVLLHGTWYPASKLGLGSFNNLKWKQAFRNNCLRYLHLRICKCLYSVYPRWKYWKRVISTVLLPAFASLWPTAMCKPNQISTFRHATGAFRKGSGQCAETYALLTVFGNLGIQKWKK